MRAAARVAHLNDPSNGFAYPLHGADRAQKALRNYGEAAAPASENLKKLRQALTVLFS